MGRARGQPSTTGNYNVMGLTEVRAQDVQQPTDAERLSEMNLSGDPTVSSTSTPPGRSTATPRG